MRLGEIMETVRFIYPTFGVTKSTFSSMLDKVLDTSKARLRAVHKLDFLCNVTFSLSLILDVPRKSVCVVAVCTAYPQISL